MTGPIGKIRKEFDTATVERSVPNRNIVAVVMDRAIKLGEAQGLGKKFATETVIRRGQEIRQEDRELYRTVQQAVVRHQFVEKAASIPVGFSPRTLDAIVAAWGEGGSFGDLAGPEGLRTKSDDEIYAADGIERAGFRVIRRLYPEPEGEQEATQTQTFEPGTINRLVSLIRRAQIDGFQGVANVLTIAWVLAEQQKAGQLSEETDTTRLVNSVRNDLVEQQLEQAGVSRGHRNALLRDKLMERIFDISDIRRVSREDLFDVPLLGDQGVDDLKSLYPDPEE